MNVRNAVEVRTEAANAAAAADVPLPQLVAQAIERQADVLQAVLPDHMSPERFEQIALAAIKATPKLVRCFETVEGRTSVLFGVIQAASVGLEINSVAREAHLIPREVSSKDDAGNWTKRWEATLQLDYRGVKKLARRDPEVAQIFAEVVREGDHFVWRRGLDADVLEHEVRGDTDRPLTHAYAVIRYRGGGPPTFIVLDEAAVHKRRAMSMSYRADLKRNPDKRSSPWFTWEAEMWRKTAIHAIRGDLNLAPDAARVIDADDRPVVYNPAVNALEPVDELPEIGDGFPSDPDDEPIADPAPLAVDDDASDDTATIEELRLMINNKQGVTFGAAVEAANEMHPGNDFADLSDVAADPIAVDDLKLWIQQQ